VISATIEATKMPRHSINDVPDTQTVCYCKDVSRATIVRVIRNGARTLEAIQQMTGAGTGTECKTKNPSGRCCAGDIEELIALHGRSSNESSSGTCCSRKE
jgi:NAD(P)H-nitrite reductase large subunit